MVKRMQASCLGLTRFLFEGEYAREVMLICPPNGPVECMPFPSASHQRNKYTVYTKVGRNVFP